MRALARARVVVMSLIGFSEMLTGHSRMQLLYLLALFVPQSLHGSLDWLELMNV